MRRKFLALVNWVLFPKYLRQAAEYSVTKSWRDKSNRNYGAGVALGRIFLRDEASEWAQHWLNHKGIKFRLSNVNLCVELTYHILYRADQ